MTKSYNLRQSRSRSESLRSPPPDHTFCHPTLLQRRSCATCGWQGLHRSCSWGQDGWQGSHRGCKCWSDRGDRNAKDKGSQPCASSQPDDGTRECKSKRVPGCRRARVLGLQLSRVCHTWGSALWGKELWQTCQFFSGFTQLHVFEPRHQGKNSGIAEHAKRLQLVVLSLQIKPSILPPSFFTSAFLLCGPLATHLLLLLHLDPLGVLCPSHSERKWPHVRLLGQDNKVNTILQQSNVSQ